MCFYPTNLHLCSSRRIWDNLVSGSWLLHRCCTSRRCPAPAALILAASAALAGVFYAFFFCSSWDCSTPQNVYALEEESSASFRAQDSNQTNPTQLPAAVARTGVEQRQKPPANTGLGGASSPFPLGSVARKSHP